MHGRRVTAFTSGRRAQNASSEGNEQTEILSLIYDKCIQPGSRNRDKLMHSRDLSR